MAKGGEHVAIDVFEVFDRRSGGSHSPTPPPRFQAARTIFAVSLAVAVLIGLAWGAYSLVRGLASHQADVAQCTAEQSQSQDVLTSWLGDRMSQATGATDTAVTPTGCTKQTVGEAIGGKLYLRDKDDVAGAVATLSEHGCELAPSAAGEGTCNVDVDGVAATVTIKKTPATDTNANGDFVWAIATAKPAA